MSKRSVSLAKMKQSISFLHPTPSKDPDQHSRNLILNSLYLGTLAIIVAALLVVCVNYFALQLHYLAPRILIILLLFGVMVSLYSLRSVKYRLASYSLLSFYFLAATFVVALWGAQTPIGTLLFALVIIIAGILLGARHALYVLGVAVFMLGLLTYLSSIGMVKPDIQWAQVPAGWYDVTVFAIILANLALVSWLFNRSMEQSLYRARRSEYALRRQKQVLADKVEQRTREVQTANFERVQEMYRFAELGQMSVGLLHDVANHLSVLSLDIEDLKEEHTSRADVAERIQESIHHLGSLTDQVRSQIKEETTNVAFNIEDELRHVAKLLEYKASVEQVTISLEFLSPTKELMIKGSLNQFWQIMTNLISNAVDAYHNFDAFDRSVIIQVVRKNSHIVIKVKDHGKGIPKEILPHIFEPFYSSKEHGTGIGLTISRRMVRKSFRGQLSATSSPKDGTTLTLTLYK